jgi:hypothetical protein
LKDGLYGYRNPKDARGCCSNPQTDRSTAAGDLVERDPPERTHKTAPLAPPALVPSSLNPPINTGIESAIDHSIKQEFFNTISPE